MRSKSKLILDAVAVTGTGTYTSATIDLTLCWGYSIVLSSTSTAAGSAKLQASIDGVTWVDLPNSGSTANVAVSAAGTYLWNVADAIYSLARVSYTNASGSGALTARSNVKGGA